MKTGRYDNVSEYFRDLVRHDQERKESAIQELRDILNRAEASGISHRTLPDIIKAARSEAKKRSLLSEQDWSYRWAGLDLSEAYFYGAGSFEHRMSNTVSVRTRKLI